MDPEIKQKPDRDYEIVAHTKISYLNIIVVEMKSRMPHLHKEVEIGLLLKGTLKLRVAGSVVHTRQAGDAYLINSMEAHEFFSEDSALILALRISPAFFRVSESDLEALWFKTSPLIREKLEAQNVYALFCWTCTELALQYIHAPFGEYYRCFTLTSILVSLLRDCLPYHRMNKKEFTPLQQRSDRILSILDYIDTNYTRKLLLEEIAEREGITLHHLSHILKNALGISFQEYLKQKRFEHACNLVLSTDMNILDISLESGFSDVRYLNDLFQTHYGCSPLEYRNRANSNESRERGRPLLNNENYPPREECTKLLFSLRNRFFLETGEMIEALFQTGNRFNTPLQENDLSPENNEKKTQF